MTRQTTIQRRSALAGNERGFLGRHLRNSWLLKRAAVPAPAADEKRGAMAESLLPLVPMILVTLFMLSAVVNPA